MEKHHYSLGILDVIFIVFLILKIAKVVTWSWWIIFSPLLLGCVFFTIAVIIIYIKNKWYYDS